MKLPATVRILVCASLAMLLQLTANAHTALTQSTPGDGATVKAAPAHIDLVFNTAVKLIKLELMGVGHEMPTNFEANTEAAASYRIETPGMHPGNFTVNWAVIGEDGHTVINSYSFVVDPNVVEEPAGGGHAGAHGDGQGHGHDNNEDH